jgi:hypothetical protein
MDELPPRWPSEATQRFYERLRVSDRIGDLEVPHSKAYYARWVIWEKTKVWYSVDHVQIAMCLEGLLDPDDLKTIPEWYCKRYHGGKQPDLEKLKARAKKIYLKNIEEQNREKGLDLPWN